MSDPKRVVKLAKMFQETINLAKKMDEIDDLEQAVRNFKAAKTQAHVAWQKELEYLQEAHEESITVQDDLKVAKKEAEDTISLAKQAAQEIISDAKEEAEVVVKLALGQERVIADHIVEDQERHAAKMKTYDEAEEVARAKVDTIEAELGDLRERIG